MKGATKSKEIRTNKNMTDARLMTFIFVCLANKVRRSDMRKYAKDSELPSSKMRIK
jgi:hypothetical protein